MAGKEMHGGILIDFLEGLLKISNLVLSVIAGIIAASMFKISQERKSLRAWKVLIVVLLLFVVQQILGALRAFGIYSSPFLTHVNVSILLGFLIYAMALQIHTYLVEK
ncbi:hypothetical protein J4401_04505 [Candidatus Woesearchaeota archaeon]|nr:hypothetical protein [Candidatus Woesearchaeota archaeon]